MSNPFKPPPPWPPPGTVRGRPLTEASAQLGAIGVLALAFEALYGSDDYIAALKAARANDPLRDTPLALETHEAMCRVARAVGELFAASENVRTLGQRSSLPTMKGGAA